MGGEGGDGLKKQVWDAETNKGPSLHHEVAGTVASRSKSASGLIQADYATFCNVLGVVRHPALHFVVRDEESRQEEMYIRNHVLDEGTVKALSCALPLTSKLCSVSLYNVGLAGAPLQLFFEALNKAPALELLQVDYNDTPEVVEYLGKARVQVLSLRGNALGRRPEQLATAIETNAYTQSLNLFDNNLNDEAGVRILTAVRWNMQLKHLSLAKNFLGQHAALAALETLTGYVVQDVSLYEAAIARIHSLNTSNNAKKRSSKSPDRLPQLEPLFDPTKLLSLDVSVKWAKGNDRLSTLNLLANNISDLGPLVTLLSERLADAEKASAALPGWWYQVSPNFGQLILARNPCTSSPDVGTESHSQELERLLGGKLQLRC